MSSLIANPPPIPTRPKSIRPDERTPEQIDIMRECSAVAIERFISLEHALAACLRCEVETMGRRCSVTYEAAYEIRRVMMRFLHTIYLDPAPGLPLCVLTPAFDLDLDEAAEEAGVVARSETVGSHHAPRDERDARPTEGGDSPDACPADTAAAAASPSDLQPPVSSLPSFPDLIVASVNDERDEILAALRLELVTVLPSSNHGRFKLVVKSTSEGSPPVGPIPMLYPEVVTVDDVRDKIVCGDLPLRLAMHASLNINLESGPPGEPLHLAAYRVHRAATNGGDR